MYYLFISNLFNSYFNTGKTTVARLFAQILLDSGLRRSGNIIETDAQKAKDGGTDEFRKLIKSAMGGCLFIDEAYALDPVGDFKGKPIVNELLTICENDRENISVILAGYEDDFNDKLFNYNEGLKSRFESVLFEDFDEGELLVIWNKMRADKKWHEETGVASVAVKRLVKQSGRKGFGNARDVRKVLERSIQAAMVRLGDDFKEETMTIEICDVLGEVRNLQCLRLFFRKIKKYILTQIHGISSGSSRESQVAIGVGGNE